MACNNTLLSSNTDVLFALGYNNGRILLNSFDTSANPAGLVGKEFSAKINRSCNTLDFNQSDNNLVRVLLFVSFHIESYKQFVLTVGIGI